MEDIIEQDRRKAGQRAGDDVRQKAIQDAPSSAVNLRCKQAEHAGSCERFSHSLARAIRRKQLPADPA